MTGEETIQIIEKLALVLGTSGTNVITYYAEWYIAASISYIILGALIVFIGFYLIDKIIGNIDDYDTPIKIIKIVCIFIGTLIIFCNIGDLCAPEGVGVHQLIMDIRGQ